MNHSSNDWTPFQKDLYEIELLKSTIEHIEPIIVGFFILQYAKLRMLELYYYFFDKFCNVNKFEELKMDTDSLYIALAEENLYDCIRTEEKRWLGKIAEIHLEQIQKQFFFHEHAVAFTRSTLKERAWPVQRRNKVYGDAMFMQQDLLLLWQQIRQDEV